MSSSRILILKSNTLSSNFSSVPTNGKILGKLLNLSTVWFLNLENWISINLVDYIVLRTTLTNCRC